MARLLPRMVPWLDTSLEQVVPDGGSVYPQLAADRPEGQARGVELDGLAEHGFVESRSASGPGWTIEVVLDRRVVYAELSS